jgi:hypothetical protein
MAMSEHSGRARREAAPCQAGRDTTTPPADTAGGQRPGAQPAAASSRNRHRCNPGHGARSVADLDAYIQELVDRAPPLTSAQRDVLALLFGRRRHRASAGSSRTPQQGERF